MCNRISLTICDDVAGVTSGVSKGLKSTRLKHIPPKFLTEISVISEFMHTFTVTNTCSLTHDKNIALEVVQKKKFGALHADKGNPKIAYPIRPN